MSVTWGDSSVTWGDPSVTPPPLLLCSESSLCSSLSSASSLSDLSSGSGAGKAEYHSLDFKIQLDAVKSGQETSLHLVAPTKQEKAAWITDISQCMDNVHLMGDGLGMVMPSLSTHLGPQFAKSDPSLFKDDVDIRFSRNLKNCKVSLT